MQIIPTLQELESSIDIKFTNDGVRLQIKKDIYLRVFWQDYLLPQGLNSDGLSIPKYLRFIIDPFDNKKLLWAILHDYFYRTQFIDKRIADIIFYVGLQQDNSNFISYIMYKGVDIWGGKAWRENSKKLEKFPEAKHRLRVIQCKNFKK